MNSRRSSVRLAFLLIAIFSDSSAGLAQDGPKAYVGGTVDVSSFGVHDLRGAPSLSFANTTNDTTIVGVTVEAGTEHGPFAVGAEINIPLRRSEITQEHGYFDPYTRISGYRELGVLGIFHAYAPTGRVRPGVLGGAGVVFQDSADQVSTTCFDPRNSCSSMGASQETTTRPAFAFTAGGDVVIDLARHVSVVPQFRIVWVNRGTRDGESPSGPTLGVNSPGYRGGIGLRIHF